MWKARSIGNLKHGRHYLFESHFMRPKNLGYIMYKPFIPSCPCNRSHAALIIASATPEQPFPHSPGYIIANNRHKSHIQSSHSVHAQTHPPEIQTQLS